MADNLVSRIWSKDASAWTDDPVGQEMIPTALGWLTLPEVMVGQRDLIDTFADEVRVEKFTHLFLLGMGGSSLWPEVLRQTFGSEPEYPALTVLDTTHPDAIAHAESSADLASTLFLVSSKSGGTVETTSLFHYFYKKLHALRGEMAGDNFVALTDPGTSLERAARERGFRRIFSTPPDVGGRYSALTFFGLVPAALTGLEAPDLLDRARAMMNACRASTGDNPGLQLGELLGNSAARGRDKVTLVSSPSIASFGLWVEQLLAESTGKEGKGLIPVADEPLGDPSSYGEDRVFVYSRVASSTDDELDRKVAALERSGRPVFRLELQRPLDLGAEIFRWEFATAVAGAILRINAFDQPNVQESKDNTNAVLADHEKTGDLPAAEASSEGAVASFLKQASSGQYVAMMAYLHPSAETDEALRSIRTSVRDQCGVATTVGYGPRFLHSTGQLHKGGPNSGLFVQAVAEPERDLEIPGQPYSFGALIKAQALGDLRSLQAHRRRAIRIDLGKDVAGGLERLKRALG